MGKHIVVRIEKMNFDNFFIKSKFEILLISKMKVLLQNFIRIFDLNSLLFSECNTPTNHLWKPTFAKKIVSINGYGFPLQGNGFPLHGQKI